MKTTVKVTEEFVLYSNDQGEYHLTLEEATELGEDKSLEKAESEIALKASSGKYTKLTIDYEAARLLGFCEYGIDDFVKKLDLDKTKTYSIEELNKMLTLDALQAYPDECFKLFGKDTLKYLGGIKGILNEDTIDLVLRKELIPEKTLHELGVQFAYSTLHLFENEYPDDNRPRRALEVKTAWIKEEYEQ